MELKLNFTPLEMIGYMMLELPSEIFEDLKTQAFSLLKNNFVGAKKNNKNLYGAIENEYYLSNTKKLEKLFQTIVPQYHKFFYKESPTLKLETVWINFQKKYEHNPLHNHHGDLSFVIWVQIPYDLEKEKKVNNIVNSNDFQSETTAFTFYYGSHLNSSTLGVEKHIIQIDKSYEGKMIVFDSKLPHSVYPFYTSEDYRISIAGNLILDKNGN